MLTKTTITPYQPNGQLEVDSPVLQLNNQLTELLLNLSIDPSKCPPDGRTGRLVFPAQEQMDLLVASFDHLIDYNLFKDVTTQRIHRFHWNRHACVDQLIIIRHKIVRYESLLSCFNVWWEGQLLDSDSHSVLCSYQRCQRWYNV